MAQDDNKPTTTPKRYDMYSDIHDGWRAQEEPQGEWVKWEDVEKLLETIETQKERLVRLQAPKK